MDTPLRRKITQSPVPTQLSSQRQWKVRTKAGL